MMVSLCGNRIQVIGPARKLWYLFGPHLIQYWSTSVATPHVQQIPAPTNLRRVETGAVQFGDDWPGLFVRGDSALDLRNKIRQLAERIGEHPDSVVGLALHQLKHIADIIDQDVRVGRS
jgi:hypothetical protein